ncbi:MAG: hypothetical protein S4CHLAM45_09700 [Chlamydiales bacterium]|nr:hypothetical protein [Chlamydiales bacterium]MCH9620212.1 hypothetical protein [Chlamydiales bacterium]MCH9623073.1 hypothetical protein [Chlamydiales bacterium]
MTLKIPLNRTLFDLQIPPAEQTSDPCEYVYNIFASLAGALTEPEQEASPQAKRALMELRWLESNSSVSTPLSILLRQQSVDLRWKDLKKVPEGVSFLLNLRSLDLGENPSIRYDFKGHLLNTLTHLNLSRASITIFPDSVLVLARLKKLDLQDNQLRKLPEGLTALSELEVLNLNRNELSTFPVVLTQCERLTDLLMENSLFHQLPDDWGKMKGQLSGLYLSNNPYVGSLSSSMLTLTQLRTFDVRGTPVAEKHSCLQRVLQFPKGPPIMSQENGATSVFRSILSE